MNQAGRIAALRDQVVAVSGGYFRNLIRTGTCSRCFTPIATPELCPPCRQESVVDGLPDAIGFMTYASADEPIQQSGRVMHGYKSPIFPSVNAMRAVRLLAALALKGHTTCLGQLVGAVPTAWAAVPSLPPKPSQDHPLAQMLRSLARPNSVEIVLHGTELPVKPRSLSAANYIVESAIPDRAHVLLIEDTWTSGGHAQSAALALRAAGAARVSLLALARWLSVGWEATTPAWMRDNLVGPDYDPYICPWTQDRCPASPRR